MHIIRILKITEESNFNTIVCTVKTCQKEGRELKFFTLSSFFNSSKKEFHAATAN